MIRRSRFNPFFQVFFLTPTHSRRILPLYPLCFNPFFQVFFLTFDRDGFSRNIAFEFQSLFSGLLFNYEDSEELVKDVKNQFQSLFSGLLFNSRPWQHSIPKHFTAAISHTGPLIKSVFSFCTSSVSIIPSKSLHIKQLPTIAYCRCFQHKIY